MNERGDSEVIERPSRVSDSSLRASTCDDTHHDPAHAERVQRILSSLLQDERYGSRMLASAVRELRPRIEAWVGAAFGRLHNDRVLREVIHGAMARLKAQGTVGHPTFRDALISAVWTEIGEMRARERVDPSQGEPRGRTAPDRDGIRWLIARSLAQRFMDSLRFSRRGLAHCLNVPLPSLHRFLDADGEEDLRSSPMMNRVARRIERVCARQEHVFELPYDDLPDGDDEAAWAREHTVSLRRIRKHADPLRGLELLPAASAQAIHAPTRYRPFMCTHALICAMNLLFRTYQEAKESGPRTRIRTTLERVDRLEEATFASTSTSIANFRPARAIGYAGSARGYAGMILGDVELIDAGAGQMLGAAGMNHEPAVDLLWPNVLLFMEFLLEGEYPCSGKWTRRAYMTARGDKVRGVKEAFRLKELPLVLRAWKSRDPVFVRRLEEGAL